jgi:hypothetical protein
VLFAVQNENADFYFKNKFEKLVHLVGFIIRIYHDARSSECQIRRKISLYKPADDVSHYVTFSGLLLRSSSQV